MAKKQTDGNLALEQQRVIVIPAHDELVARKLRVAAYARVSSSSEDQLSSYRVQNQYYSELISSNPDWEMVDIYADEGITGTSVEKREDFQRMMQDCRKGKIDRILVKSISRFARNTKDCLAAVRELKELGVSVLFEEQGIDTSKVSSEMVTAIMASLAQKGSESISGNVQWGYQKRMRDGTFIPPFLPYGYKTVDIITWDNLRQCPVPGSPINYPNGAPEFKRYQEAYNMKYTIVPANTPEQDRFVSISDFKECMHWGGEVEFIWKGTRYGAVRYGQGNKISVYVANRQETERLYDTADEALEYMVGEDRLRDVITKVEVRFRSI